MLERSTPMAIFIVTNVVIEPLVTALISIINQTE